MTEHYPRSNANDELLANMDTTPIPVRRFTAPGFDDKGTEMLDSINLDTEEIDTRELRRRAHLGDIATKGIYDRQDELNRVLGPDMNAHETESFNAGLINVAALRARLHGDSPMHVDGVRPGEVSTNSRARRDEIMSKASNPSWIRR